MTKAAEAGARVGKLTIIADLGPSPHGTRVTIQCDCGSPPKDTYLSNLGAGKTLSCGCLRATACSVRNTTHGMRHSRTYRIWRGIMERIDNEKRENYRRYGGRGLDVAPRWRASFEAFHRDMGDPPTNRHSIERKDNSIGYWPDNCLWATLFEQGKNKRNNVYVLLHGAKVIVAEAERVLGVRAGAVGDYVRKRRITHQQAIDRLVTLPTGEVRHVIEAPAATQEDAM